MFVGEIYQKSNFSDVHNSNIKFIKFKRAKLFK